METCSLKEAINVKIVIEKNLLSDRLILFLPFEENKFSKIVVLLSFEVDSYVRHQRSARKLPLNPERSK